MGLVDNALHNAYYLQSVDQGHIEKRENDKNIYICLPVGIFSFRRFRCFKLSLSETEISQRKSEISTTFVLFKPVFIVLRACVCVCARLRHGCTCVHVFV